MLVVILWGEFRENFYKGRLRDKFRDKPLDEVGGSFSSGNREMGLVSVFNLI